MKHFLPFILILASCGGSANSGPGNQKFTEPGVLEHRGGEGGSEAVAVGGSAGDPGIGSPSGGAAGGTAAETGGTGGIDTTTDAGVAGASPGGAGGTTVDPSGGSGGTDSAGAGGSSSGGTDQGTGGSIGVDPLPECDNGTIRCSTDIQTQTCVNGHWQDGNACDFACENGECVGSCTNGNETCHGLDSVICVNHEYVVQTTCDFVCSGGVCSGECTPGSVSCDGQSRLTCGTDGIWSASECDFVCSSGQCTGVCTPDAVRCSPTASDARQTCNAQGQWEETVCDAVANSDVTCKGVDAKCVSSCKVDESDRPLFYDCDNDLSNGCEVADGPGNCGGCGISCNVQGWQSIPSGGGASNRAFDANQETAVWATSRVNDTVITSKEFGSSTSFSATISAISDTTTVRYARGDEFVVQIGDKFILYNALTGSRSTVLSGQGAPKYWTVSGQDLYFIGLTTTWYQRVNLDNPGSPVTVEMGSFGFDRIGYSQNTLVFQNISGPAYGTLNLNNNVYQADWTDGIQACSGMAVADDVMVVYGNKILSNGCRYDTQTRVRSGFGSLFNNIASGDSQVVYFVNKTGDSKIIRKTSAITGTEDASGSLTSDQPVQQLKVSGNYLYWIDSNHVWRTTK